MKKIILSAAVAAMAFSTSAVAADKGIDIVTTGQAVVYYETADANGVDGGGDTSKGMFDNSNSVANVGLQLNLAADLKNNFTFGSQITYLGGAGLTKNVVGGAKQGVTSNNNSTTDELALTKIFIAKKIANTTVKLGRQELPKSLSPLAFSEGWSTFKNTFDAIVAINSDIPNTTLVGAYVSGGTDFNNLTSTSDLEANVRTTLGTLSADIASTAYMITAQTTVIPMTTLTATYYALNDVGVTFSNGTGATSNGVGTDAYWLDAKIAPKDAPMGLKVDLQAGQISPDSTLKNVSAVAGADLEFDDTTAFGIKVSAKIDAISLSAAYTSVDGDDTKMNVAIQNTGTGVKSPLYTQMVYNQNAISLDADTLVLKAGYNMGDMGSISLAYGMTDAGRSNLMNADMTAGNENDYKEWDVVYKLKTGGVQYFAAYVNRDMDKVASTLSGSPADNLTDATSEDIVRLWARYNF